MKMFVLFLMMLVKLSASDFYDQKVQFNFPNKLSEQIAIEKIKDVANSVEFRKLGLKGVRFVGEPNEEKNAFLIENAIPKEIKFGDLISIMQDFFGFEVRLENEYLVLYERGGAVQTLTVTNSEVLQKMVRESLEIKELGQINSEHLKKFMIKKKIGFDSIKFIPELNYFVINVNDEDLLYFKALLLISERSKMRAAPAPF